VIATIEIAAETAAGAITEAAVEAIAEAIIRPTFFLLPILVVNIYSIVEAVRIKGIFRNRPSVIIIGIKQVVKREIYRVVVAIGYVRGGCVRESLASYT
jgi:hypothetical protein